MADVITELRRPSTLGAVTFAVIGWVLLIWNFAASSSDQDALRNQLGSAEKRGGLLADELKRERDAAGTMADLAAKRTTAAADLQHLQAQAQDATRARDDAKAGLDSLTGELADIQHVSQEAATLRDKTLAELDAARQQGDTVKQAFARASDQLAQKNSELAALNGKVQELQASSAKQANAQAEGAKRLVQADDATKALVAQQTEANRGIQEAQKQLAAARAELSAVDEQIADRQKQLAAPLQSEGNAQP